MNRDWAAILKFNYYTMRLQQDSSHIISLQLYPDKPKHSFPMFVYFFFESVGMLQITNIGVGGQQFSFSQFYAVICKMDLSE